MPESRNYLLGYGERLTERIPPVRHPSKKKDPYTFAEALHRLAPRIKNAVREIADLPQSACPHDESIAAVTLHPTYLAKTFFPQDLFRAVGVEPVGSRPRMIRPEKGAKKATNETPKPDSPTVDIFVRGKREAFQRWATGISKWHEANDGASELVRLEDVRLVHPAERMRPMRSKTDNPLLEVVLHRGDSYVLEGFRDFLRELGVRINLDRRIQVQSLCFIPVRVPRQLHERMAQFSFLRVAREMPSLRELLPAALHSPLRSARSYPVNFPDVEPVNSELRVGVFDGGLPEGILPEKVVHRKKIPGIGSGVSEYRAHGLGVTSALLYGSLKKDNPPDRPLTSVEHFRVIDETTSQDLQGHYFEVLNRIMNVLRQNHFDFVNLSLGPDLPVEDDEVHVWTASLDEHFSEGQTVVTVAAGNTGDADWDSGNARIQAPADGVNVLCVGAADSPTEQWKRASYSSIGPGRSPGIVKPDILAFGGSEAHPFWVPGITRPGYTEAIQGTSFASPLALRAAIGVRVFLGSVVQPIALRALLIHHSDATDCDQREVGWGRIPQEIESLITCPAGSVHVLYQGELEPARYLRARIPLPGSGLRGNVTLTATFCYATRIDPQDPLNYTRAGLEVTFRPDKDRFAETPNGLSINPTTKSFFSSKPFANEEALRRDAHKWEPCLKVSKTFRAGTLNDPFFDIHYNARRGGLNDSFADPIPYALVITVHSRNMPDIYNKIAQRYRTILEPLRPVIQIPVRVA